uniref:deoxyhypusine synthase n=1 Tax=Parastrongyloides trichosuri TaxID=131310 RepID=A0A0N4ZI09_PARTI
MATDGNGSTKILSSDIETARGAVLKEAKEFQHSNIKIQGYDFNQGIDYEKILDSYLSTGFQASHLGKAIEQIREMIKIRNETLVLEEGIDACFPYPKNRTKKKLTIFLGYTSNLISSGLRDIFKYLAQHNMVDCIVTTAGGIEEDFIKSLKPSFLGEFKMDGKMLRESGMNRAGNVIIPNQNYCAFEDWIMPIFDDIIAKGNNILTPSKLINILGEKINNEESVYYWCWKNNIPVYCPGITDGSLGDMLYFHSATRDKSLIIDVVEDIKNINTMAIRSNKTGCIILGGGIVKHHINNANLFRNGSDYTIYVNTGIEDDGSDSGARPDEAVSWGKIKSDATPVKVFSDATLVFPLIVAKTFAQSLNKD